MRYPIGVQSFEKLRTGHYVYVDKTDLIYRLTGENVCFLSRPRRFGKSLLISTLEAYFSGKKELFAGLKIDALEKDWLTYPVFRIDFAVGDYTRTNELESVLTAYLDEWEKVYGKQTDSTSFGIRFWNVIKQAKMKTGSNVVVLIDEYDKPLLDALGTPVEEINRNILKGFYGAFKAADDDLRFVLLTGVTKFSQISVFSGFNQPNDISMDSRYDAICGITEAELDTYFSESIHEMSEVTHTSSEHIRAALKRRYDGYHFSEQMLDIYNPFSVLNAFNRMKIADYWFASGTPSYLIKLLEGHHVNMRELTENTYEAKYFMDSQADGEDPLAMLYQSGYLTIKGYDAQYDAFALDYPNEEVQTGFVTLLAADYFHKPERESDSWIKNLDHMLRCGDTKGIRKAFTAFLASIPYEANKDERSLDYESHYQYTFYLVMRMLSAYTTLIEKQNSKGRADLIIESISDIYIFEFKLDGSAKEALQQIEKCQYAVPYLNDHRRMHKIGVNISSRTRTVEEWAEA